jgi:hypothetical protein
MQISLSFNPAEDNHVTVTRVVDAVYGVKTSPNAASVPTGNNTPVLDAPTSPAALNVDASSTVNQSPVVAPGVSSFPNHSTAPTAAALDTPAVNGPAGVVLDKNGIPWDARIHSGGVNDDGTHKKNKDGSWAKKKGVDDLTASNITKELQNLMAAQIGHAAPPAGLPAGGVLGNPVNTPHQEAVPLPTDPNAYVIAPSGIAIAPMPAPVAEPAPTTLQPQIAPMPMGDAPQLAPTVAPMPLPIPQPAAAPTDYNSLAVWLAPNLEESGGKLKREHVEHFCRQCNIVNAQGVGEFALVANRPDAVAWLFQAFTQQIAAMA